MKNLPPLSVEGFFFTLLMLFSLTSTSAQSDIISTTILHDAETLIRDFFLDGDCIEVFGFELSGEVGQAGVFSNGTASIGLESGIILSTGNVMDAVGPNDDPETSTLYGNVGNYMDLETLDTIYTGSPTPRTLSDIVVLEFYFTPTVEEARFDFVFASEEYCFYSLTSFIDIFGFFVSGPGLNGPYEDDGINVALVPNTDTPITAFTINEFNNAAFYVNNTIPTAPDNICTITPPAVPNLIEFDGFTTPLVASFDVIPCETYHVKLAITDTTDDILDSAVFLKAQSFVAGRTADVSSNIQGQNEGENAPYEGCGSADIIFSRGDGISTNDLVVHYEILPSSSATSGVDFTLLPDSIVIPAGALADTFHVDFFADDTNEGNEEFTIKLRNPCSCTESELTFTIIDPLPLSGTIEGPLEVCNGDALLLAGVPNGGFGEIHYQWQNNDPDSLYNVTPSVSGIHQLILSDDCLQRDTIEHFVDVLSPQTIIDGSGVICDGLPGFSYSVELIGADTFAFSVLQGGSLTEYIDITEDTLWIPATETGVFQVINAIGDGCTAVSDGFAQALAVDIQTTLMIDSIDCNNVNDATAMVEPSGGDGFYSYIWSHDALNDQSTAIDLGIGEYEVFINDSQGCVDTVQFELTQPEVFVLEIDTIQLEVNCLINGSLLGVASGGVMPYSYSWSNGPVTAMNDDLSPGEYTLVATDDNDCTLELTVEILDNGDLPVIEIFATDSLDCDVESVTITTGNSSLGGDLQYIWTNSANEVLVLADSTNWDTSTADTYTLEITNVVTTCTSSLTIVITEDIQIPPAEISANIINLNCYDPTAELMAEQVSQDWMAEWNHIDVDTLIASDQWNIDVFAGGDYELIVTNTMNQCESRDTIHINEQFSPPVATIPVPDSLTCLASEVILEVDITNGSGSYTYEWSGPVDGISGATDEAEATATLAGDYQLIIIDGFSGCRDTLSTTVVIDVSSLMIDPLPDSTLTCLVEEISLTATSPSPGNLQYTWFDEDDVVVSMIADILITEIGEYTVNIVDIDNNCEQSTTITIDSDYTEPTIFPNAVASIDCITSSVELSALPVIGQRPIWLDNSGTILVEDVWAYTATAPGDYQIQVTDSINGCFSLHDFRVLMDTIPPTGNIDVPGELTCENNDLDLMGNATSGSGNYAYVWTGPLGGINGPSDAPMVNIGTAGTYFLTITDNENGCSVELSTEVMENGDFPEIDPLPQDTLITCLQPTLVIIATSPTIGNLSFRWLNEDDAVVSNSATLNVTQTGIYTVELTNNDNNCTSSYSISIDDDFMPPSVNAGFDAEINCQDEFALLTAIDTSDLLIPSWYDSNDVLLSTGQWTYQTNMTGTYTLSVLNPENGCSNTDTAIVGLNQDTPSADAGMDVLMDCFTNTAIIDVSGSSTGGNIKYELFDSDGELVQTGNSTIFSVNETGLYQLVVTNTVNNCVAEDFVLVDAEAPEIIEISSVNAFCFGQEGTIIVEEVTGGTPPYLYSIDGGNTYQTSNVFNALEAGSYDIAVQDINSCVGLSTGVIGQPTEMILILPDVIELALGDSVIIEPGLNRDTIGLTSITWSKSDQLDCLDCFNPQFTATETQLLELIIIDESGCEVTAQVLIVVDQRVPVYVPNAFSPHNGDGINDMLTVYGNANQVVEISSFNIFNRWGSQVFAGKTSPVNDPDYGWDGRWNGQRLNAGVFVYTLEILLINGERVQLAGEIMLVD